MKNPARGRAYSRQLKIELGCMSKAASMADVLQRSAHRYNKNRNNKKIETTAKKAWATELPLWLQPLVQNRLWAKRYARLLRENPIELRKTAERALQARKPYHYMNRACSHAQWPRTLERWAEMLKVDRCAAEVIKRLQATKKQVPAIYAACYRYGTTALRHAVTAAETARHSRFKYFCWLTSPKRFEEVRGHA